MLKILSLIFLFIMFNGCASEVSFVGNPDSTDSTDSTDVGKAFEAIDPDIQAAFPGGIEVYSANNQFIGNLTLVKGNNQKNNPPHSILYGIIRPNHYLFYLDSNGYFSVRTSMSNEKMQRGFIGVNLDWTKFGLIGKPENDYDLAWYSYIPRGLMKRKDILYPNKGDLYFFAYFKSLEYYYYFAFLCYDISKEQADAAGKFLPNTDDSDRIEQRVIEGGPPFEYEVYNQRDEELTNSSDLISKSTVSYYQGGTLIYEKKKCVRDVFEISNIPYYATGMLRFVAKVSGKDIEIDTINEFAKDHLYS